MNRIKKSRLWIVGAVAGASLVLGMAGCAATQRGHAGGSILIPVGDDSAKIAQAQRLAIRAQNADTPAKAIELYRQANAVYPRLAPIWNNLGVLQMQQQQYLDAAQAFTTASELQPTDPRPMYNLGLTWEKAGYLKDAFRYYGESLGRDARYQPALRGAIRAQRLMGGATEQTLRRLRTALGQESDDQWRQWFELQKPQVEAEVYATHADTDTK